MTTIFAIGLFDNPWVVAVIILGGAVVNWLSQRRQAKQPGQEQRPEDAAAPTANKPAGEFNMEETLRRLLGEQLPPPSSVPPPVPQPTRAAPKVAPRRTAQAGNTVAVKRTPPKLTPPSLEVAPAAAIYQVGQTREQAAVRFEQLNEQGQHPAKALDLRRHHSRAGAPTAMWRDRRSVRRAFVASLVFGPPKGLET